MVNPSVAHPRTLTTPEPTPEYVLRGHGLFELHRDELAYLGAGTWLIPSGSDGSRSYEVRVGVRPERNRCECVGFQHHGHCSHVICASIAKKKSAICDACGARHYLEALREVHDEDGLTSWLAGDRLCSKCIAEGAWT